MSPPFQEPLEDSVADILRKALRGLEMSAIPIPLPKEHLYALLEKPENESDLRSVALALHLQPDRLLAISRGRYHPQAVCLPEGLLRFQTNFDSIRVNSYLAWDSITHHAVAFDTGADASELLGTLTTHHLQLEYLLLTHAHGDHIFDLDRIVEKTGATAWTAEKLSGAHLFIPGKTFPVGSLNVETRLTNGHSPAGITYVIYGLSRIVAIVGDALFAGSVGGANVSYEDALRTCASEILSLPDDTLICPGHGPLTTVKEEKASNPFFSEL